MKSTFLLLTAGKTVERKLVCVLFYTDVYILLLKTILLFQTKITTFNKLYFPDKINLTVYFNSFTTPDEVWVM